MSQAFASDERPTSSGAATTATSAATSRSATTAAIGDHRIATAATAPTGEVERRGTHRHQRGEFGDGATAVGERVEVELGHRHVLEGDHRIAKRDHSAKSAHTAAWSEALFASQVTVSYSRSPRVESWDRP